jgi:hypothetical protein
LCVVRRRALEPLERDIAPERDEVRRAELAQRVWGRNRKRVDAVNAGRVPEPQCGNNGREVVIVLWKLRRESEMSRDCGWRTVKPMISAGGVMLPPGVVSPGPSAKRSEMALTQGNPTVAEKGFPGPDLHQVSRKQSYKHCIPIVIVEVVRILIVQPAGRGELETSVKRE